MNSWLYADTAERFSHHIGIEKCPDPVGVARMCDDPRNTVLFHHFLNALQEEKTGGDEGVGRYYGDSLL